VNVQAGGGSLLTLPVLIFLGLPTAVANGTNRVAILFQCAVATGSFKRMGFDTIRLGLRLSVTAVVGAIIGSRIAIEVSDSVFRLVLSLVMVMALAVILFRRKPEADACDLGESSGAGIRHPVLQYFLFLIVGLYGGFIQAGVGFMQLFALYVIGGLSLVRANCVKLFVAGIYLIPSLVVFIAYGKVAWVPAIVLAAGTGLGAWLGAQFAVRKGERWIKAVLALAVLGMAGRLAGLY
jgi:uncharacterized membrane protein YfcA